MGTTVKGREVVTVEAVHISADGEHLVILSNGAVLGGLAEIAIDPVSKKSLPLARLSVYIHAGE